MPSAAVRVVRADLQDPVAQENFLTLLDAYMRHPMGANRPLSEELQPTLIRDLKANPNCYILFAVDGDEHLGMAVCFRGYSTFNARPLINIHDFFVEEAHRGQGVGLQLLRAIEQLGHEIDCCRITLEVRDDNHRARGVYQQFGFDADGGSFSFLYKSID